MFPSPCGDYGSYLLGYERTADAIRAHVSVPLRGLWFLSTNIMTAKEEVKKEVSVPLRGLWFLSFRL